MSHVALAWTIQKQTIPIVGFSNLARLDEAVDVKGKTLTDEEIAYLEEPYEPSNWENLVFRYEEPNPMTRWDSSDTGSPGRASPERRAIQRSNAYPLVRANVTVSASDVGSENITVYLQPVWCRGSSPCSPGTSSRPPGGVAWVTNG